MPDCGVLSLPVRGRLLLLFPLIPPRPGHASGRRQSGPAQPAAHPACECWRGAARRDRASRRLKAAEPLQECSQRSLPYRETTPPATRRQPGFVPSSRGWQDGRGAAACGARDGRIAWTIPFRPETVSALSIRPTPSCRWPRGAEYRSAARPGHTTQRASSADAGAVGGTSRKKPRSMPEGWVRRSRGPSTTGTVVTASQRRRSSLRSTVQPG